MNKNTKLYKQKVAALAKARKAKAAKAKEKIAILIEETDDESLTKPTQDKPPVPSDDDFDARAAERVIARYRTKAEQFLALAAMIENTP